MRRFSLAAPLLVGLSVCALSCQRVAPPGGDAAGAGATKSPGGGPAGAAPRPPAAPRTPLKVGDPAPDFALTDAEGRPVRLSDFRGRKNVALAFYVLAFTGG